MSSLPLLAYAEEVRQNSHACGPSTEREAFAAYVAGGKAGAHEAIVLRYVERFPGRTAIELWALMTATDQATLKEPQRVRQRLNSAMNKGLVTQGMPRRCAIRNTAQVTWRLMQSAT